MIRTGGTWDPGDRSLYFLAAALGDFEHTLDVHKHILVAINELRDTNALAILRSMIGERGAQVYIDSGAYWLAMSHATTHQITLPEAFGLPPDQLDGYDKLLDRYVDVLRVIGDSVWGYVELDLGGRDYKIKTRAKLEAAGLRPIPVYHPLNDGGWDYFDHLAEHYDRVCYGNLVQAEQDARRRLLATMWERRKRFPHVWVHVLGVAPNEMLTAYPLESCDSSTWLSGVRWGAVDAVCANARCWNVGKGFCYDREADTISQLYNKAKKLGAYEGAMMQRTTRLLQIETTIELECEL
jgi:hypothetical protein